MNSTVRTKGIVGAPDSSISTTITHTVTLGKGGYVSPLTITSTGTIEPGSAGATGLVVPKGMIGAVVLNQGRIAGGGSNNNGGNAGVGVVASSGTLTNDGAIIGGAGGREGAFGIIHGTAGGSGVYLSGGTLINAGDIAGGHGGDGGRSNGEYGGSGGSGVYVDGGTLITSGTISGGAGGEGDPNGAGGDAVQFGTTAATLIVDPGAAFGGLVVANGVNDVLQLAGTSAGTLNGSQFIGFATITEAAGAIWTLAGGHGLSTSGSLDIDGTLRGSGVVQGAILDDGKIAAVGGLLDLTGPITGSGLLVVHNNATLELGRATTLNVGYGEGTATLQLAAQSSFTGAIKGLAVGDTIVFSNETVSSAVLSGRVLTVTGSAGVTDYTVKGALAGNHFMVEADQHTVILASGPRAGLAPASFLAPEPMLAAPTDAAPPAVPMLAELTSLATPWTDATHMDGGAGNGIDPNTYFSGEGGLDTNHHGVHDATWHHVGHVG